jgi:protein gp37
MKDTPISWCHHSCNFWSGCNHVSRECDGCYIFPIIKRQGHDPKKVRPGSIATISQAFKWNLEAKAAGKNFLVFTCSMGDFFHPQGDKWRDNAWDVIRLTPHIYWMILTKRPERILANLPKDWGDGYPNVWLGTTVGCRESYKRADILRKIPARIRFISAEPLLESIADIDLTGIHWLAAGGMSGPRHVQDAMQLEWAAELYDRCKAEGVAYLFKQVSAFRSEQGVNALNLYLAKRNHKKIDPATCKLIRNHPKMERELMPFPLVGPAHKGRFTMAKWEKYKSGQTETEQELVNIKV